MERRQTLAFILRTVDYGDYHVIAHLLGRQTGRFSAIAHGARSSKRRFAGGLEPMRVLEATYRPSRSGDLYRLEELDVIERFSGLDKRIETLTAAGYSTELTRETLREGEEAAEIFDLLREFYRHLPRCTTSLSIARLVHQFEYKLLALYGSAPSIHHCGRCGKSSQAMDKFRFGRRGQGLICANCRHRSDTVGIVGAETLMVLHHLSDPDQPLPDEGIDSALAQCGRVLENAIDQLIERPLAARQMLHQMLQIGYTDD